jgi:hypothetical protein
MRLERGLFSLAAPATCPDCAASTYRSVSFARWFSSLPYDGRCEVSQLLRWVGRGIGLDLHRDFCEIAICEDGVVRSAGRVSMTPEALEAFAASLESTDRVALEV